MFRGKPGHYTDQPTRPYVGNRQRQPRHRAIWTERNLLDAEIGSHQLMASIAPSLGEQHTLAVAPEPGSPFPWEGSFGGVNSGNGNKLTSIPLFSWKARGGMTVDFTLYHNSQTNYDDELGYGWTWTYDIYINVSGSTATVHWGDGLCVPFTQEGGGGGGTSSTGATGVTGLTEGDADAEPFEGASYRDAEFATVYNPPAGIFDSLVKNDDNTWTLTKKDGTKYLFNTSGFCTAIQDRNGNTISITLNAQNYATAVTDPTGRQYTISLSSNKFASVTDENGNTWSFTRNGSGDLTTITWPTLGGTSYTDSFSYTNHRITTHTDRRGKSWTYTYNTDGSLASETNPLNKTSTYTYTQGGTTFKDPRNKTIVHNYSNGMLASVVDQSSFSESYTSRNTNKQVTARTDRRGKSWSYTYDSRGNLLTVTDPRSQVTTMTYSTANELLTVTDPLSNVTTYTYNSAGRLLTVKDDLNHTLETHTYDSYGQRLSTTNALSKTWSFDYDADGNLESVTDPLSHVTSFGYDGMSRLTSTTNALNHTSSIAYDVWGRPTTYTNPDSTTRVLTYNPVGQVATETDENGHTTTFTYSDAGQLTGKTNAENESESYAYDDVGRMTSVTNGRGKVRTYTYTDRGEVASLTMPDSAVESWSYNGNGQTTAYTNPLSQVIYYTFDDAGRQTGIDYPTGTDVTFGYDNANRRTSMVDSTGTTSWTYDDCNRLTQLSTPQGNISYGYNNANMRTSMTDATGTTSYSYDDAGRRTSLTNPHSETTSFTYDNADRLTKVTYSTGAYVDTTLSNRGWPTQIHHKTSAHATIFSESYTHDDVGNILTRTTGGVTTTFTYDDIDQLLSESRTGYSASYTYDANGNRTSKTLGGVTETYVIDDGDKLDKITVSGVTIKDYSYDAAGRTTSVVTSSGTTTLSYDYESRITQITYPNSSTNTFTYNGLDTRVSKVDSGGTKTYRRDGAYVTDPVLSDSSTTFTPGISSRASGASTFDHHDWLGTARTQTSSAQATTATRTYDAFGLLVSSTGTPKTAFGFAGAHGYQEDPDSGLKLLGHRYYDPSTGRFLTRDPIKDGRNWYAYAHNNPARKVDPDGRLPLVPIVLGVLLVIEIIDTGNDIKEIIENPGDPINWLWPIIGILDPTPGNGGKRIGKTLYRVVEAAEETSLVRHGGIPTIGDPPAYQSGKMFWETADEASQYQKIAPGAGNEPTQIWEFPNPERVGERQEFTDFIGHPIFVPAPDLSRLGPGRPLGGTIYP